LLCLAPYTIEPSARYVAERRAVMARLMCGTNSCTSAWHAQDATASGRSGSQPASVLGTPSSRRSTEKLCSKRPGAGLSEVRVTPSAADHRLPVMTACSSCGSLLRRTTGTSPHWVLTSQSSGCRLMQRMRRRCRPGSGPADHPEHRGSGGRARAAAPGPGPARSGDQRRCCCRHCPVAGSPRGLRLRRRRGGPGRPAAGGTRSRVCRSGRPLVSRCAWSAGSQRRPSSGRLCRSGPDHHRRSRPWPRAVRKAASCTVPTRSSTRSAVGCEATGPNSAA